MRFFIITFLLLFSGCSFLKYRGTFLDENFRKEYVEKNKDLNDDWKEEILKGKIPVGMDKGKVEEILGKDYQIYKSDTGMMEIWFYENYSVGFDENGKVVKFKMFERKIK